MILPFNGGEFSYNKTSKQRRYSMVETKKRNDDESIGRFVLDIIIMFAILMGIYYFIFSFFLSNETVSGPSMQPTFENGDRLIAVRHFTPKRNDIVILKAPDQKVLCISSELLVHLVIWLLLKMISFTLTANKLQNHI